MQTTASPEFDPKNPLQSAMTVLREIFLSPRRFYLNFYADGPLREPTLFVLLIGAVSAGLAAAAAIAAGLVFGEAGLREIGLTALQAVLYAMLSPLAVAVVAAVYLLSVRTFVGKVATFRQLYRMAAYAFGVMILAPIPAVGAFATTYALMVLMGLGIRFVYRTSFLTAVVSALVAFLPVGVALIWLTVTVAGLLFG
ncbi:MAG: YIP1 family protein [Actinomycetota bacterium]